jgi:hypothetical protein
VKLDRARVHAAVDGAEKATGLQLCVAVCSQSDVPPRQQAEAAFTRLGTDQRPAALIMVLPDARRVEVVTGAGSPLTDVDCERAVSAMTASFAAGQIEVGIESGLQVLVAAAGPGGPEGAELPDVIDV